jgi:hypothetical protein
MVSLTAPAEAFACRGMSNTRHRVGDRQGKLNPYGSILKVELAKKPAFLEGFHSSAPKLGADSFAA